MYKIQSGQSTNKMVYLHIKNWSDIILNEPQTNTLYYGIKKQAKNIIDFLIKSRYNPTQDKQNFAILRGLLEEKHNIKPPCYYLVRKQLNWRSAL